ncbi:1-alkyl-2-acetylglycerophosphocholine esterase [Aphelenchoides fujianensis]|nr:1-alkyl-2-acetylglycerophosphocholine esterase [Aphelenchoides fujianensis]
MGLGSSSPNTRPTSSLPVVGKGEYEVGCADLMVAAEGEGDCGLFARVFYPASPCHESREEPIQYPLWKPRTEYLDGLAAYRCMHPRKMHFFFDWIVGERRVPAGWHLPLFSRRLERANRHPNASLHGSQSAGQLSQQSREEVEGRVPHSHSAECLEDDEEEPSFPVLFFSHGNHSNALSNTNVVSLRSADLQKASSGHRLCYSVLCASLASYGYVVVAIEHRDRSASWSYTLQTDPISGVVIEKPVHMTSYPDGEAEFKHRNREMHYRVGEIPSRVLRVRRAEPWRRGTDRPEADRLEDHPRLRLRLVAVQGPAGHEQGGGRWPLVRRGLAIAAAAFSTDFSTAVSLDGWLYPIENALYPRISQPLLFLNAKSWQWPENVARMFLMERRSVFTFK